ncbi:MAG: alpha/beta hydrolase [Cyanothece sp. SIO1E1]|nr:alpha/beta hydrolase [Cyanothece sp. SIO1E1]
MSFLAIILSILAILFIGLYLASFLSVQRAQAKFPPIGKFLNAKGIRLHYLCSGQGRPVVLVHGNPGFIQDYSPAVLSKVAQEYQVCAFDRPGHGYSDRPQNASVTPLVQAQLIHDALQQLEIEKPVLVGFSWGGALALAYALEYPDELSGIVLLGTLAFQRQRLNSLLEQISETPILGELFRILLPITLGPQLVRQNLRRAFLPERIPRNYLKTAAALWPRPSQTRAVTQDNLTINPTLAGLSQLYGEIKIPVVIVVGDNDLIVNAEENSLALNQAIAQSQLITLSNTGHVIPQAQPEAVLNAIRMIWEHQNA